MELKIDNRLREENYGLMEGTSRHLEAYKKQRGGKDVSKYK